MDINCQSESDILSKLANMTEHFNESNSFSALALVEAVNHQSAIGFFHTHLGEGVVTQYLPSNGAIEDYVDALIGFYIQGNNRLPGSDSDPVMAEWECKIYLETGGTGNELLRRAIMSRRHSIDLESKFSGLYQRIKQH